MTELFCGDCVFYFREHCRRFPPAHGGWEGIYEVHVWPPVNVIDFCGEFQSTEITTWPDGSKTRQTFLDIKDQEWIDREGSPGLTQTTEQT